MERLPKGIYTPEFRAEAVKLVEAEGLSVDAAAKRLSVPKSSLGNWVRASRTGNLAKVGQGQRVPTETEIELARLRKELAEVKLERDLLKNGLCSRFPLVLSNGMPKQCFWRELSGAVFDQAAPTQVVGQVGGRDAVKSPNPLLEARVVGIACWT